MIRGLWPALVLALLVAPCAGHMTLVQHAREDVGFQILVEAIEAANLTGALSATHENTLLAPTDAAFDALFAKMGITKAQFLQRDDLVSIISYHLLPGTNIINDALAATQAFATLHGAEVTVAKVGGEVRVDDVRVQYALECSDGYLEVLGSVLLPPLPCAETVEREGLSIFLEALREARLVDTLNGAGPYTVFAPADAAMRALLAELGVTKEDFLGRADLADILKFHVVRGTMKSSAVTSAGTAGLTLEGGILTLGRDADGAMRAGSAKVVEADIAASNGVVHVIDSVLWPATPTTTMEAPSDASGARSAHALLQKVLGLAACLPTAALLLPAKVGGGR